MSRYPLDAVLALRRREDDVARGALEAALAAEATARDRRDAAATALAVHRAAAVCAPREPGHAEALQRAARSAARRRGVEAALAASLQAEEGRLGLATEAVGERRSALARARAAVRALERHRERWEAARRRAGERDEDDACDDAASARGARQRG